MKDRQTDRQTEAGIVDRVKKSELLFSIKYRFSREGFCILFEMNIEFGLLGLGLEDFAV
jgi:hypothetical protein